MTRRSEGEGVGGIAHVLDRQLAALVAHDGEGAPATLRRPSDASPCGRRVGGG